MYNFDHKTSHLLQNRSINSDITAKQQIHIIYITRVDARGVDKLNNTIDRS